MQFTDNQRLSSGAETVAGGVAAPLEWGCLEGLELCLAWDLPTMPGVPGASTPRAAGWEALSLRREDAGR